MSLIKVENLSLKINNKKPLAIVDAEYFIHQQSMNKKLDQ